MVAWVITNAILFHMAYIGNKKLWIIFAGLSYCLPTTIFVIICVAFSLLYFKKIYNAARDEVSYTPAYEPWEPVKTVYLDPVITVYPDESSVSMTLDTVV